LWEYHQSIPARIREKFRGMPRCWNTCGLVEHPTMDGLPAPEFLPCSEDIVLVPASLYMTDLAKALPKPHGQAVNVEQRLEKKKEKRKERKKKKKKAISRKAATAAGQAAFTLPLR
jgi:hypothetical protein